ncbi:hypothetical protein FBY06_11817 [Pseudomonas sp. SJZ085]|nr:hypothetical protein FBX99_118127 [Pseudomonas sp. SJZ074]TWC35111.1 hypothetical protein FBY06_11817 [Pseudomonas sp. SJZ085]
MEITGIQIKSMQNAQRNYDAIILKFGDMHFTKDLLSGPGGDRDIRRVEQMSKAFSVALDCYEPQLQERIAEALK